MRALLPLLPLLLLPSFGMPGVAPRARVTSEQLGGEARCIASVSTDKPIYRGGETLFARGVILDANTHRPLSNIPYAHVEILGPKGDVVASSNASGSDGVVAFSWSVPDGQAGGNHRVRFSGPGFAPGERPFEVRAFRAPRIKAQIAFLRNGYGAGDPVSATIQATRAEGGAPAGAALTLIAMVDGREVANASAGTIDAAGRASVSFTLPASIERGEGTLALVIEDGGVVETVTKTIPILLHVVDLSIHPEGGDLVAGLPCRVYFEARTTAGKPADIAGVIETGDGRVVARFRTEHEGRGRVQLRPEAGERYRARIIEPSGIKTTCDLPAVQPSGGSLAAFDDVVAAGAPLRIRVASTRSGPHVLTVARHEQEIATARVALAAGELRHARIALPEEAEGVLRVTLWDADGLPVAERLMFRQPAGAVRVSLTCDRERYAPAGLVTLRVKTARADGSAVAAMVGLCVSDDSVREILETRDQPPSLPVQVFLGNDVRELADAAVYLNPDDPKAPRAVDLLLGTQGWRRFAWITPPEEFVASHDDMGRRALALTAPAERQLVMPASVAAGAVAPAILDAMVQRMLPGMLHEGRARMEQARAIPAEAPRDGAEGLAFRQQKLGRAEVHGDKDDPRREDFARELFDADERDNNAFRKRALASVIREYAHVVRPDRAPSARVDFTDTVYWNAGLKTDASGEASVTFALSDSVTSFRAEGQAFTDDGALGSGDILIESGEPFYLEAKLPLEITCGDVVRLPVAIVNGTPGRIAGTATATAPSALRIGKLPAFSLADGERQRSLLDITAGQQAGSFELTIAGSAGSFSDSVTRSLRVAPLGFPTSRSFGGTLGPGSPASHVLEVPQDVVPSSLRADIKVFPSSLGKLNGALERLIQEPYGCFEQTSSTTYPLIMAQQYFMTHPGVDPTLVTRSQEMLAKGYERLTGFETGTKGYEWFGESPGHEALSAFGLMEFTDMARVRHVDPAMLARTREWLLATRDGKGGFKRERRALHSWIEDKDSSNAYILWTLLEAGEPATTLAVEIDALARAARSSQNSYVHALAANVMQLAGRSEEAGALLTRLADVQDETGGLDGATASIVGSTGEALQIEATSLATLAWLRSPAHGASVAKAIRFLTESCQGGRYGSTQSTVLALRAIVKHDDLHRHPPAAGSIQLTLDGRPVGAPVSFAASSDGALVLPDLAPLLGAGSHRIGLAMEGGADMPYAIEIVMNRQVPDSSPDCPLALDVELTRDRLVEGDIAEATAIITNRMDEPLPMAIAIIGLPGGLEPRHEQLKELVRAKSIAAYEVTGREVAIYFRSLEPRAVKRVPLSLVAAIPGTYTAPASRAYLYYGDEHRTWVPGFRVEVAPK